MNGLLVLSFMAGLVWGAVLVLAGFWLHGRRRS